MRLKMNDNDINISPSSIMQKKLNCKNFPSPLNQLLPIGEPSILIAEQLLLNYKQLYDIYFIDFIVFTQKKNEKKVIRALDQVVHIYPERWRFVDNTPSSNWIFFFNTIFVSSHMYHSPEGIRVPGIEPANCFKLDWMYQGLEPGKVFQQEDYCTNIQRLVV